MKSPNVNGTQLDPELEVVVAEADKKLSSMLDIQALQLEETKGLRSDLRRILDRLSIDPLPVTGETREGD